MMMMVLMVGLAIGQSPMLLSSVQALTLKAGHQTASRRGPPVPQLQCTGGNCDEGAQHVKVMQCHSKGLDSYGMPQWECKAEVPSGWRLGTTDVSCEGYANADDPYILAGSCGVEYTIHGPPPPAPKPHPPPRQVPLPQPILQRQESVTKQEQSSWSKFLDGIMIVFVIILAIFVLILIIYCCSMIEAAEARRPRVVRPIVYPPAPMYPVVQPPLGYANYGYQPVPVVATSSSSLGDFAVGYAMGSNSNSNNRHHSPPPPPPPRRRSPSPSPSSSPPRRERSPSPVKVTSTGYGTTKRR